MAEALGLDWTEADSAFTSLHECVPADDAPAQCTLGTFSGVSSALAELVAAAKSRAAERQQDDSLWSALDEASSGLGSGGLSAGARALLAARDELQFGAPASALSAKLWTAFEEVGDGSASVRREKNRRGRAWRRVSEAPLLLSASLYTHTHTYTYIDVYICTCRYVYVCICM